MPQTIASQAMIRPASAADLPVIGRLRYRFRADLGQPAETEAVFLERFLPWLHDHLAHPLWRIWVAALPDGEIIGTIFLNLIEKVPNPVVEAEQIAYLTNAYVLPDHRNAGLGARLLQTALDACPDAYSAILWPSPQSHSLYERSGFAPPATILERKLSG